MRAFIDIAARFLRWCRASLVAFWTTETPPENWDQLSVTASTQAAETSPETWDEFDRRIR